MNCSLKSLSFIACSTLQTIRQSFSQISKSSDNARSEGILTNLKKEPIHKAQGMNIESKSLSFTCIHKRFLYPIVQEKSIRQLNRPLAQDHPIECKKQHALKMLCTYQDPIILSGILQHD